MRRARESQGSVVLNKRSGTWHFLWLEAGKRRSKVIGSLDDFRTKRQLGVKPKPSSSHCNNQTGNPALSGKLIGCLQTGKDAGAFQHQACIRSLVQQPYRASMG